MNNQKQMFFWMPEKDDQTSNVTLKIKIDSPYEVPDAIVGSFDEAERKLIIEFRYAWPERGRPRKLAEHITAFESPRGRLTKLELSIERLGIDSVKLMYEKAVQSLSEQEKFKVPTRLLRSHQGNFEGYASKALAAAG